MKEKKIPSEKEIVEKALEEVAEKEGIPKKHILIVDDDVRILRLLKKYLSKYEVATAINGRIALRFLETKETDLVLLDYEMPLDDGPTVLEKIRANEKTKDLPVIFLTGISSRQKIQEVLQMKPQGYLLKPINTAKLLETIEKYIG